MNTERQHAPPGAPGREWVVEAYGCDPTALADARAVRSLIGRIVREMSLHPVGEPLLHTFPPPGGVTGLSLLSESHLTVHTFPEHGSLCLNLFCCSPRPEGDFRTALVETFGADRVEVRHLVRDYGAGVPAP